MLQPKRTKFRKAHKGRIHGMAKGGTQLNFGAYGLKAVTPHQAGPYVLALSSFPTLTSAHIFHIRLQSCALPLASQRRYCY